MLVFSSPQSPATSNQQPLLSRRPIISARMPGARSSRSKAYRKVRRSTENGSRLSFCCRMVSGVRIARIARRRGGDDAGVPNRYVEESLTKPTPRAPDCDAAGKKMGCSQEVGRAPQITGFYYGLFITKAVTFVNGEFRFFFGEYPLQFHGP